jgi:hypothetical protein
MKRAQTGKADNRSKKTSLQLRRERKRVDLGVVQQQITNLVGNRALAMVETMIEEVDKGHYLGVKYLLEIVGLCPATSPEEALEEDSLAKTLLRRLKLPEEIYSGTEVTKDSVVDPVEQGVMP